MNVTAFNRYCASLPHAQHVVQWSGSHVWKVGPKLFVLANDREGTGLHVTFKVSPMAYDILKEQPGLRPAPYLASRGMKWIQRTDAQAMTNAALKDYIKESHRLVALGLPKTLRAKLGL
jgi:predicted DNA-binding protein (MmcQ/YjbR family)